MNPPILAEINVILVLQLKRLMKADGEQAQILQTGWHASFHSACRVLALNRICRAPVPLCDRFPADAVGELTEKILPKITLRAHQKI